MLRSMASIRLRFSILLLRPVLSVLLVCLLLAQNLFGQEPMTCCIPCITTPFDTAVGRALDFHPIGLSYSTTDPLFSFRTEFMLQRPNQGGWSNVNFAFVMTQDNTTNGSVSGHNFAVEFNMDCQQDSNYLNDNHVGVSFNSSKSIKLDYNPNSPTLNQTAPFLFVWIEYNRTILDVTISLNTTKPAGPFMSTTVNLTAVPGEFNYVGLTSAATNFSLEPKVDFGWYVLGPGESGGNSSNHKSKIMIGVSVSLSLLSLLLVTLTVVFHHRYQQKRNANREKLSQITELDRLPDHFGAHKIRYKDLRDGTGKFCEKKQLGKGGFGWVYKGVLPGSNVEVAVKRIAKTSKQGAREFMAEVKIIGRMRHRNLVPLIGWCHHKSKGELLLVYEYMPEGSLDHLLFHKTRSSVTTAPAVLLWEQRLKILIGVATALQFLHEDYEQCVLHRDVKASNVMLDADFNARLGDFGLARLYDHNQGPQTTMMLAGTLGYMAPELFQDGKATKKTDVYSFGALTLEIATGYQATERHPDGNTLVDWVWSHFSLGCIMNVADCSLGTSYSEKEMELVLHMGLLCSHPDPNQRPTMRQSLSYLKMEAPFPIDMLPPQRPLHPSASNYGGSIVDVVLSRTRSITQLQNDTSQDSDQRKVEFSSSLSTAVTSDQLSGGR